MEAVLIVAICFMFLRQIAITNFVSHDTNDNDHPPHHHLTVSCVDQNVNNSAESILDTSSTLDSSDLNL